MIRSVRSRRHRVFRASSLESLELRSLLSNLPALPSPLPASLPYTSQVSTSDGATAGTIAFGAAVVSEKSITTMPADSSSVVTGPSQLVITFSQPVSTFDLGFNDIRLDLVASDSTTTSMFDPSNWPIEIANDADGFGFTFTQLTIPLDSPLADGTYQIVLVGGSLISSDLANGNWDPFSDYVISTFTVGEPVQSRDTGGGDQEVAAQDPVVATYSGLQPTANVQSLTDLGTFPISSSIAPGVLSQVTGQSSVALYRFSVPEGHHWQLGLSAPTGIDDSGFQTVLTLYKINVDGSLTAISLGDPGAAISSPQRDGFTYLGIDAGTYCLAVSGIFANLDSNTPAGSFQLELEATPADQASQVTSFQLNLVSSNDDTPAALTIQFSSPIQLNGFSEANEKTPPLEVVDSHGKIWKIIPFDYQEKSNSLTLVFGEKLPPGTYSLRIGSVKGLTDLAGWTPVAKGMADGVLATWTIESKQAGPQSPYLGVVWPSSNSGISRIEEVQAGDKTEFQFVTIVPGFYKLQTLLGQGGVEARIVSVDGKVYLDTLTESQVNSNQIYLPAGAYILQWIGRGAVTAELAWTLTSSKIDWESLLNNGVGQWSSINLGFGSPAVGPTPTTPSQSPSPGQNPSETNTVVAPPLMLTPSVANAPAGKPSSQSQSIAVISPMGTVGSILAHASPSQVTAPRFRKSLRSNLQGRTGSMISASSSSTTEERVDDAAAESAQQVVSADQPGTSDSSEIIADQQVLASADWILKVGQIIVDWASPTPRPSGITTDLPSRSTETLSLAGLDQADLNRSGGHETDHVEKASFGLPLGVILATAFAYRAKDPVLRWWKKDRQRHASHRTSRTSGSDNTPDSGRLNLKKGSSVHGETVSFIKGPHMKPRTKHIGAGLQSRSRHEGWHR